MFDAESNTRAQKLLTEFGATGFHLDLNGHLYAKVGEHLFSIKGEHVQFTLNDGEQAEQEALEMIRRAQALEIAGKAPEPGILARAAAFLRPGIDPQG